MRRPEETRKRLLLLAPDGVGVRNFLLEPCGSVLRESFDMRVLTGFPVNLVPAHWQELSQEMAIYREGARGMLLRYALADAHLYRWDTPAMRFVRNMKVHGRWKMKVLRAASRVMGRAMASDRGIARIEEMLQALVRRRGEVRHYQELLTDWRPDVVLCTHQRPSSVLPIVLAARILGIPAATFIFSWDNLTSKGRIAAPFEHFLVWSDLMKEELLRYYPDVDEERVHVVGTPQFDAYADPDLVMKREDFFEQIGADPDRKLICYSGGDSTTCPNEPAQLGYVMELARQGRFTGNPQILFRPSPADAGDRFRTVRERYPELIFSQPRWIYPQSGGWTNIVPTQEDVSLLTNLTAHCDVNINVASTMTLDFALHDKPVVNIGFDIGRDGVTHPWLDYYSFDHYRPVVELGAARVARSGDELAFHVNRYLEQPEADGEGRRRLREMQVGQPLGRASHHIAEVVNRIVEVGVTA